MVTRCRLLSLAGLALLLTSMVACEKVPLLAPTGSTITLTVPTNVVAANQAVDIIAQVLEASGTPPHSGTSITFTSSLGTVTPATALTDANGRVIVRFQAGAASGIANITAISGGASTGVNSLKLSIGTAAVGAVRVNATPASVSALGGSTTIVANVLDINGNGLPSASVIFSTSAGSLSSSVVTTDGAGVATTVLTTAQQAVVTAAVGAQGGSSTGTTGATGGTGSTGTTTTTSGQASGSVTVTVNTAPTLVITPPSAAPSAGIPASYTFAVTAASTGGTAVRNLRVSWGDGNAQDLGAVTGNAVVSHTYGSTGSYTITATLTDAAGNVQTVSTAVNVIPVSLPTIIITPSVPGGCTSSGTTPCEVTLTIQVTVPTGIGVIATRVNFGDNSPNSSLGGLVGTAVIKHSYPPHATYQIQVEVDDTIGRTTIGTQSVTVP